MSEAMLELVNRLSSRHGIAIESKSFDSGASMIDVRRGNRFWVVSISASGFIGIEELTELTQFGEVFSNGFEDVAEAFAYLDNVLS